MKSRITGIEWFSIFIITIISTRMKMALFFLTVVCFGVVSGAETVFREYVNAGFDGKLFKENVIFKFGAQSTMHCGSLCNQHPCCVSFTFDPDLKVCRGHGKAMTSTNQSTTAPAAQTYVGQEGGKGGYIGCFPDKVNRVLPRVLVDKQITNEKCNQYCLSEQYPFFATQHYDECYCGHSYNKHEQLDDSHCNLPCGGNASQICGGSWKNSVYCTG